MTTFTEICQLWRSDAELANDIGEPPTAVQKWRQRNKIPSEHWLKLVRAARRRRFQGVTLASLARIAADRRDSLSAER